MAHDNTLNDLKISADDKERIKCEVIKLLGKKKRASRIVDNSSLHETLSALEIYFDHDRKLEYVTLEEAVQMAGFKNPSSILKYSYETAVYMKKEGMLEDYHMAIEEAMAIAIYTYDNGQDARASSPYMMVNKCLRNKEPVDKLIYYILHLLSALRKVPEYSNKGSLFRAIAGSVDEKTKKSGSNLTWPGFTSVTTERDLAIDFLNYLSETEENSEKYIVEIVGDSNYCHDIKSFSFHPNEEGIHPTC